MATDAPVIAEHRRGNLDPQWLRCPNCDYRLQGLPQPTCPECGTAAWLAGNDWHLNPGWRSLLCLAAVAWAIGQLAWATLLLLPMGSVLRSSGDGSSQFWLLFSVLLNIGGSAAAISNWLLVGGAIWGCIAGCLRPRGFASVRAFLATLVLGQLKGCLDLVLIIVLRLTSSAHPWIFRIPELLLDAIALALLCLSVRTAPRGRSSRWELLAAALIVAAAFTMLWVTWPTLPDLRSVGRAAGGGLLWSLQPAMWLCLLWRMRRGSKSTHQPTARM